MSGTPACSMLRDDGRRRWISTSWANRPATARVTNPIPARCAVSLTESPSVSCRKRARVITVVARTACSAAPTTRNGTTRGSRTRSRARGPAPWRTGGPSSGSSPQMAPALATASAAEK